MKTTTSREIAKQLRILADAFDANPDLELEPLHIDSPHVGSDDKKRFIDLAKCLPRPIENAWGSEDLKITWGKPWGDPVSLTATISRKHICRMVEPAKPAVYEWDPLLSEDEIDSLGGAQ